MQRRWRDSERPSSWAKLAGTPLDQCVLYDQPAMAEKPRSECCCEVGQIEKPRLRASSCIQAIEEMERWERERPMLASERETALSHAVRVLFKTLKLVCAKFRQFKDAKLSDC